VEERVSSKGRRVFVVLSDRRASMALLVERETRRRRSVDKAYALRGYTACAASNVEDMGTCSIKRSLIV